MISLTVISGLIFYIASCDLDNPPQKRGAFYLRQDMRHLLI